MRERVRGQYMPKRGSEMSRDRKVHTRPSRALKYNYSSSPFNQLCGASPELGMFFNGHRGSKWNQASCRAVMTELRNTWDKKKGHRTRRAKMFIVADNDRVWSTAAMRKFLETELNIWVLHQPANSPDIQVFDSRIFSFAEKHCARVMTRKLQKTGTKIINF